MRLYFIIWLFLVGFIACTDDSTHAGTTMDMSSDDAVEDNHDDGLNGDADGG